MTANPESIRSARWRRKALRAFRDGDLPAAEKFAARLLREQPDSPEGRFISGVCTLEQNRPAAALPDLQRATALDAARADYWAQQARCLAILGDPKEAMVALDRAVGLGPADALTHDTLGSVLTRLGRFHEAAEQFAAAVELEPGNIEFQYHHANGRLFCGELDRAREIFEHILVLDPGHLRAHLALSDLIDAPPGEGRIEELEAALAGSGGDSERELILGQALARNLEAAGDTAAAFALWSSSKASRKLTLRYTIDEDRRIFADFMRLFETAGDPEGAPGTLSEAPIFVIGMPRSGTTLVERILASHSRVSSGGELNYLPQSVREAGGGPATRLIDIDSLAPALAADPERIGRRYLELARTVVGDPVRFVDKLPLNYFFVGYIRRALPNARIVCLRRSALDTCLASFRQLFALGFRYYRYALSLSDTAEYYAMFDRLMRHWDGLYPGRIYRLQYEKLVGDTETEVRRLFEYLELEFEDSVLEFERNPAAVATASAAQVRRPVYSGSAGAWKRYAKELEPLREQLESLGIDPTGIE